MEEIKPIDIRNNIRDVVMQYHLSLLSMESEGFSVIVRIEMTIIVEDVSIADGG